MAAEYRIGLEVACSLVVVVVVVLCEAPAAEREKPAQGPAAVDVEEARVDRTRPDHSLLKVLPGETKRSKTKQQAAEWVRQAGHQDQKTAVMT